MGPASAILLKRVAPIVAVLALLAVIFVLVAPRLVSIEVVRRSMSREIAGWSGRSLTFEGTPQVAFTPYLTVTFPNVRIGSSRNETTLVEMDSLRALVPILPLIFRGRIEPASFVFSRPKFHFAVDGAGVANWDLPNGLDATSPVRQLVITDGSIDYSGGSGSVVRVDRINAVLNLPDPRSPASVQGSAEWQGRTASFYASVDSPAGLIEGAEADTRLVLESDILRGSFEGSLRQLDGLTGSGQLSLSTPSLSGLATLLSIPTERLPRLGAASISSQTDLSRGTLTLGDAALTIDGNQGVGGVSLSLAGLRPSVQATLAFDLLDITSYLTAARDILRTSQMAPDAPLDWPRLERFNADLRLSADRLKIGEEVAGRVAASLALRDGRLDVAIGELQLYGGRLTASLSAEMQGAAPSGSLQAKLDGVSLKSSLGDLLDIGALDGTAGGTLSLQARGESWNALVASLTGRGSASIANGVLDGINLSVLTGSTAPPAGLEGRLFNGSTRFASAKSSLAIGDGKVSAPDIAIAGADFSIDMEAEAELGSPVLTARGQATLGGKRQPALTVPFEVGGTWSHPRVTPRLPAAPTAP